MSMVDMEKQWFDAFRSYGEKFATARPAYDALDKEAQTIGALMHLELDLYNGGFLQFFCNWGHSAYLLAVDGLEQMEALTAKSLIVEAFSVIDPYGNDDRVKALWDLPGILSDEESAKLNQLDEKYWEDEDSVMERMLSVFAKNR